MCSAISCIFLWLPDRSLRLFVRSVSEHFPSVSSDRSQVSLGWFGSSGNATIAVRSSGERAHSSGVRYWALQPRRFLGRASARASWCSLLPVPSSLGEKTHRPSFLHASVAPVRPVYTGWPPGGAPSAPSGALPECPVPGSFPEYALCYFADCFRSAFLFRSSSVFDLRFAIWFFM
jgi:hypothetical protein